MQKKILESDDNLLETYCRQVKKFPLLTFEEELALSRQVQDENEKSHVRDAALHKLVNSNLRLVLKIAGMFNVPGIPLLDLIQEGNIGLLHAAKKYNYRKNVRFCTYSSWWVRQFINRYISNKRRLVRLPERKEETLRKIQQAYHVLCQTLKHQPNNWEIANEIGVSVQDVESFINITAEYNSEAANPVDIWEDYTYCPERNLLRQASRDDTMRVLNKLPENERHILNYRFQLNGCKRYTLREIGNKLQISPETVRKIEQRALRKIRSHANELRECL